jgi:hypothetical protein
MSRPLARRLLLLTSLCLCLFGPARLPADSQDRARADRLLERSVPLYNTKRYQAASELCRRAIVADPTYARSFVGYGRCQEKLNQRQAACAAYRQALILSPNARDKQNALEGLKRLGCAVVPPSRPGPKPLPSLPAPSEVLVVSARSDGDYRTLGEAIEAASANTRIMVRPGRYNETVVLKKPLQLVGDGPRSAIILAGTDKPALIVQAPNCFLRNLSFKAFIVKDADFAAVAVRRGSGTFDNCEIGAQSRSGMRVSSGATAIVRQSRFIGARTNDLAFAANAGGRVEDCDIFGANGAGVEIGAEAHPAFLRTKIHHNKAKGVLVEERGRGSFIDCAMTDNTFAGFEVKRGATPFLQRCGITHNYIGLYLWPGSNPRMINCSLRDNAKIDRQRKAGF